MRDASLRARVIKGLGASALSQVLGFGSRIVLMPLFLHAWGVDLYGHWLVVSSLVIYVSFADMGGQVYIVNRMTAAFARQDEALFRQVAQTGMAISLALPAAAVLLFAGVAALAPAGLLGGQASAPLRMVAVLLALQAAQAIPLNLVLGIYRAVGMLPLGVMLFNTTQTLHLGLTATALWLRADIVTVAALQLVPACAVALGALRDLRRRFPQLGLLSMTAVDLALARSFVRPSLQFLSILAAGALATQGTVVVVGALLAPSAVVLLSALRAMTNVMRQGLGLLAHTVWPEITRLDAQRDVDGLTRLVRALLRTALLAAVAIVLALHHLGGWLYHAWIGHSPAYDPVLMDIFLVYGLQQVFWTACSNVLMATNHQEGLPRVLLAAACLSLALAAAAAPWLGLRGVVLGLLAGEMLLALWYVPVLLGRYQAALGPAFSLRTAGPAAGAALAGVLVPWSMPVAIGALAVWAWRAVAAGGTGPMTAAARR